MTKNLFFLLFVVFISSCATQSHTDSDEILNSKSISEIEEYMKNMHPQDPKKFILKSKLIALKNKEWTKGAATAKPMEVRPIISNFPKEFRNKINDKNTESFEKLMVETSSEHKEKTTKLLNTMFNEDISSKEVIILFKNNSDCNLVLKISGKKFYNLAVTAHSDNFIVVEKDNYDISGNVCEVQYTSKKLVKSNIQIALENPQYKINTDTEVLAKEETKKKVNLKSKKGMKIKKQSSKKL